MNTLSYGLLGLLARGSLSGYDLMLKIQPFWQAKHSQIYPLLSKLEQEGYVSHVHIEQKDKPDKKVYSIQDKGINALQDWIVQPTTSPVVRDEMLLKVYCLWLTDTAKAIPLFKERIELYTTKLAYYNKLLGEIQLESGESQRHMHISSPLFAQYIMLKKAQGSAEANLEWCQWVLSLLHN